MIYYSNTRLDVPHMTFIGRWSPFHKGHAAIIQKKMHEQPKTPILLMVRNTTSEAYSPISRAHYLKLWMQDNHVTGTIMIVPNIEGVYWGREVGYNVGLVDVDAATRQISGTNIRHRIKQRQGDWKHVVGLPASAHLLSPNITTIIERGLVVWLTGWPSSGKTTIAQGILQDIHIHYPHLKTQLLDGDDMRANPLARDVGFSPEDRAAHIIRMAYLAKLFADQGILVVCAFVSPDRRVREQAKKMIGKHRFIEVFVKASKQTCMRRDTKGLYRKAKEGRLHNLTGFNAPYEPPLHPTITCNTDRQSVHRCVERILVAIFSGA